MTRKFWITIDKHEEFETRFCISLRPYRYRSSPKTKRKIDFVSTRSFASPGDAIREARSLFGNVMIFKADRTGRYSASLTLDATDSN